MNEQNALEKREVKLKEFMRSDEIRFRFSEIVGNNNTAGYISSVLIAVSENITLQTCTPGSIISAALRAATMGLSVEPSIGQAYLVPFKDKATLVVGWKGIYHMAIRTGEYRYLELHHVYEGETVTQDRMTGIHRFEGGKKSDRVIGYLLYFKLMNGFEKTFYMTVEECLSHGKMYSKTFNRDDSIWKKNPDAMCRKTVMRLGLTRWGYLKPSDVQAMNAMDETDVDLSGFVGNYTPSGDELSEEKAMLDLGFSPDPKPENKPEPEDRNPPKNQPAKDVMQNNGHERPFEPEVLREKMTALVVYFQEKIDRGEASSKDSDGFVISNHIEMVWAGNKDAAEKRHVVTRYLIGKGSVKEFTDAEKLAFKHWLKISKDESSGEWVHCKEAGIEATQVYRQALVDAGQAELDFPVENGG